jgi:hypothetical protein
MGLLPRLGRYFDSADVCDVTVVLSGREFICRLSRQVTGTERVHEVLPPDHPRVQEISRDLAGWFAAGGRFTSTHDGVLLQYERTTTEVQTIVRTVNEPELPADSHDARSHVPARYEQLFGRCARHLARVGGRLNLIVEVSDGIYFSYFQQDVRSFLPAKQYTILSDSSASR